MAQYIMYGTVHSVWHSTLYTAQYVHYVWHSIVYCIVQLPFNFVITCIEEYRMYAYCTVQYVLYIGRDRVKNCSMVSWG